MALVTTTLSGAVTVNDNSIAVVSATSVAAGRVIICDGEQMEVVKGYVSGTTVPVLRGRGGTKTAAHVSGANVTHGTAADFADPGVGGFPVNWPNMRTRTIASYVASGAIALPAPGTDAVAILIGTSALTMTVAAPTKDMDGCILYIMGSAKSASTIAFDATNGLGNAGSGYDVLTLQTAGNVGVSVMAINGFWNTLQAPLTGTSTALSAAIA